MDRLASMETFIRVVETRSFSGAARQLRVGQPAVSKTVAQLETYLGVKLLTRSTRGLTPTEAGLGYFERAKRAIEEADEAELAARGAGTGLKGRLRVCAAVTFARIHLIPLLPQFLAQHPDLDLEVVLDSICGRCFRVGAPRRRKRGLLLISSNAALTPDRHGGSHRDECLSRLSMRRMSNLPRLLKSYSRAE
jgi:hypothetical protein